jgi:hypothetical protein
VVRWGQRVNPLGSTSIDLPPNDKSALDILARYRKIRAA